MLNRILTESDLKLAVLDCAYDLWDDEKIRTLFVDMLTLKLKGYGPEYPYGALPIDPSDFFATHLITYFNDEKGKMVPISTYKMVSLTRCQEFRKEFSALSLTRESNEPAHFKIVEETVKNAQKNQKEIGYCGSWTIAFEIRKNQELTKTIRDMSVATHVHWQKEYRVQEMIVGSVLRFKTDKLHEAVGYRRLTYQGNDLAPFGIRNLGDEMVALLHLQNISEYALNLSKKYQDFWSNRVLFANHPVSETKAA